MKRQKFYKTFSLYSFHTFAYPMALSPFHLVSAMTLSDVKTEAFQDFLFSHDLSCNKLDIMYLKKHIPNFYTFFPASSYLISPLCYKNGFTFLELFSEFEPLIAEKLVQINYFFFKGRLYPISDLRDIQYLIEHAPCPSLKNTFQATSSDKILNYLIISWLLSYYRNFLGHFFQFLSLPPKT